MNNKIAILRGINVGGKRKILMADLKQMFQDLGFTDIKTYIQSGNVIFKANAENKELENKIESAIKDKFGFDVPVIVRTSKELIESIGRNPFYKPNADIKNLHLTFLKKEPGKENKQFTETYNYEPDKFIIDEKDVFVFCEGKYHQSKLTNNFFEKKLKVGATTRNWKTILKLVE
ncbi:Uncharacterized conserved protein, DUF1697 family [Salegentibacter echinorum]|uniref:Uncharacterized conserved protein, DUF1697 family n=1 Tax=Salegentibacter echinorum TaxID=1073325 RepID=A0A1M5I1K3_SALEC|nr:DUF1697 domain-containing protein [Salegentibacter echinorum]SHG22125.1 Uncharacterized conserved protein, DUF1697 family [Salegentibacter echinorum]